MYDENSFKNYIFWLKVKRGFLMLLFSIIGATIGVIISSFLINTLTILGPSSRVIIIAVSTVLFFSISLLLTAGTGKEVQDGYWKMAVLRKLTVISKKLDYLENLEHTSPESAKVVQKVAKEIKEVVNEDTKENVKEEAKNENIEHENLSIFDKIDELDRERADQKINTKPLSRK